MYRFFRNKIDYFEIIKNIDKNFTRKDFDYCKKGTKPSDGHIYKCFKKLLSIDNFQSTGCYLDNYRGKKKRGLDQLLLSLEKDSDYYKAIYKLVMCSDILLQKFSKFFPDKAHLICQMWIMHGLGLNSIDFLDTIVIDILFDNEKFFTTLRFNEWVFLCEHSATIFKKFLLKSLIFSKK